MIKIYHNNRCRKSREGLQTVQASEKPYEIIDYISSPLSARELEEIISILEISPIDLVRQNEAIWKSAQIRSCFQSSHVNIRRTLGFTGFTRHT